MEIEIGKGDGAEHNLMTTTKEAESDDTTIATVMESEKVDSNADDKQKELLELNNFINDLENKIKLKTEQKRENLTCVRPPESHFFLLDSSLKKNTAFVKKLKQFTTAQLDPLLKDMLALNLTKYISEVSSALVEAKLKITDVPAAIILCSKLHQIYVDFSSTFLENWQKILTIKSGEKIQNPSKMRVDLRYFAELISVGIINHKSGLILLGTTLSNLIAQDKDEHNNLSIILPFCRHCGEEYAGLIPRTMYELTQKYKRTIPSSTLLSSDKQQNLRNLLKDYYTTLSKHLRSEHKHVQNAIKVNRKIMETKGEVANERKEKLETLQANFDKLLTSAQTMSDLLNEPMIELIKDNETLSGGVVLDMSDDVLNAQLDPWGDDETKSFYVDLPDLRLFLPNYAPKNLPPIPSDEPAMTEEALDMEIDPTQIEVDDVPLSSEETNSKSRSPEPVIEESPSDNATNNNTTTTSTATPTSTTNTSSSTNHQNNIYPTKYQFEIFTQNLANCVNKELIDSVAIEFLLNLNTKSNRKKLARVLFGVQRTRLDLLPFFARLVATINLVSHDVAVDLANLLKQEFRYHIRKKNQMNIESKLKVIRFIGEMVKFSLYSKIEGLFCLKLLLTDFQHHQIEMACAFFEVAGKYLYNCKDTRIRTNVYLEQMWRLKTVQALDSRHAAQIENAYYFVKPPETVNIQQKIRPPICQYIRYLIFEDLNKSNVDKIIKLMRRLNWDDKDINDYAIKCLSKAYNIRYHLIRCLADLVSGISSYQDKVACKVIDTVFEDVRAGLEIHSSKLAQRRIAMAKYLGELYNYRLIDSSNILNTLYVIISLGVTFDQEIISEIDPPHSLFRLKLACVLLDTCGQYFTSPISRKRLDYFLIFFQHYYWFKKSNDIFTSVKNRDLFPILIDHLYKECMFVVRPKINLYKNYEEATEAVEKLRLQIYPNLFSTIDSGGGDTNTDENSPIGLDTINEEMMEQELTNSELTEPDTSEAVGESDEDLNNRRKHLHDDYDAINTNDDERDVSSPTPADNQDNVPLKIEKSQDDLEFEQLFDKMATDSYQERLRESIKPTTKDIPVPMKMSKIVGGGSGSNISSSSSNSMNSFNNKKTFDQLHGGNNLNNLNNPQSINMNDTIKPDNTVPFVLMVRGGNTKGNSNKQQFKTFKAPADSPLAVNLRLQEQKIREEKEKVKRLTLNITERIEEEDYQESLLQSQRSPAQNRTSQKLNKTQKYKHQKGAPDADLIFG